MPRGDLEHVRLSVDGHEPGAASGQGSHVAPPPVPTSRTVPPSPRASSALRVVWVGADRPASIDRSPRRAKSPAGTPTATRGRPRGWPGIAHSPSAAAQSLRAGRPRAAASPPERLVGVGAERRRRPLIGSRSPSKRSGFVTSRSDPPWAGSPTTSTRTAPSGESNTSSIVRIGEHGTAASSSAASHSAAGRAANASPSNAVRSSRCTTRSWLVANRGRRSTPGGPRPRTFAGTTGRCRPRG